MNNHVAEPFRAALNAFAEPNRCQCDGEYVYTEYPLGHAVGTSRGCPIHGECENCMERLGVMWDPQYDKLATFPQYAGRKPKREWLCADCARLCLECGEYPCKPTCSEHPSQVAERARLCEMEEDNRRSPFPSTIGGNC